MAPLEETQMNAKNSEYLKSLNEKRILFRLTCIPASQNKEYDELEYAKDEQEKDTEKCHPHQRIPTYHLITLFLYCDYGEHRKTVHNVFILPLSFYYISFPIKSCMCITISLSSTAQFSTSAPGVDTRRSTRRVRVLDSSAGFQSNDSTTVRGYTYHEPTNTHRGFFMGPSAR